MGAPVTLVVVIVVGFEVTQALRQRTHQPVCSPHRQRDPIPSRNIIPVAAATSVPEGTSAPMGRNGSRQRRGGINAKGLNGAGPIAGGRWAAGAAVTGDGGSPEHEGLAAAAEDLQVD